MTAHGRAWSSQIGRVLAMLPTTQREVLRLRLVVELSVEETAAVLGSTPEEVFLAEYRAKRALREELLAASRRQAPADRAGDSGPAAE